MRSLYEFYEASLKTSIHFSGLGIELGQMHRGLKDSPEKALQYISILENAGIEVENQGVIVLAKHGRAKFFNESDLKKIGWSHFEEAYHKTFSLLQSNKKLLNWGGDHSIALATVGAFVEAFPDGHVIWIDAHADLNLPSYSLTGNLHGMPMAMLLNLNNIARYNFSWIKSLLKPERIIYIGLRSLDPFEEETIEKLGITTFTRRRVRKWGIDNVLNEVIHKIGKNPVHISFDIDSVDPRIAPSTGVPVNDGLSEEELMKMSERFRSSLDIRSIDMVELNPLIGTSLQVDQTFITAMHFLKNLFAHPGGYDESMGQRNQAKHTTQVEWAF